MKLFCPLHWLYLVESQHCPCFLLQNLDDSMSRLKIFVLWIGQGETFLCSFLRNHTSRMVIPEPDVLPPELFLKSYLDEPIIFRKSLWSHSATWTLNMCKQYVSHLNSSTGLKTNYTVHSICSKPKYFSTRTKDIICLKLKQSTHTLMFSGK